jgi:glycerate dehydrogenase
MKIVVLDGYTLNPGDNPWKALAELGEVNKVPLTAETLARLPRLRFVSVLATGYNMIDVAAARQRGVVVSNVPEYGTDSVAQHVFALLLDLCHHVGAHHDAVIGGEWVAAQDFCFWKTPPIELAGLAMGIIGFGRIGRRVGEIAHAFGMTVIAADPSARCEPEYQPFTQADIPAVFAAADVVSLHCPLTGTNARFVDRQLLGRMKPSAFFINTARGQLVDEQALADALDGGQLAGAGLDVVAVEPMRADNPLLHAHNCVITPHMAWASLAARRRLMAATVSNVKAFLSGHAINVVD